MGSEAAGCDKAGRVAKIGTTALCAFALLASALLTGCFSWRSDDDPPSMGPQTTVLILARFGGEDARPRIRSARRYTFFMAQADAWLREASQGQTWLQGLIDPSTPATIIGPIDLSALDRDCDDEGFMRRARLRILDHRDVRTVIGDRAEEIERLILVMGGVDCDSAAGMSWPTRTSRIRTARYTTTAAYLKPSSHWGAHTHELLHGLGIGHAIGWDCGDDPQDLSDCSVVNGGHPLSLMGSPQFQGQLDAVHMNHLGWLDCDVVRPGHGPVVLDALEQAPGENPQCIRVPVRGGAIFMEHRSFQGLDAVPLTSWETSHNLYHGVMLYLQPRTATGIDTRVSRLLSMGQLAEPRACAGLPFKACAREHAALEEGQTFTHPDGTRITVLEHTPYQSTISIEED